MKCKEYGNIRLWQGDCMELMQDKPENHWDLAIVDPPYGIGVKSWDFTEPNRPLLSHAIINGYTKYEHKDWDNDIPHKKYFSTLFKITNEQVIFGANYFSHLLPQSRGWFYWAKGDDMKASNNFSHGEIVYTSLDKRVLSFDYSCKKGTRGGLDRIHPTQKPVALYRWILQNYANKGDTILDTHGGSMSLAIACHIEGFELDIIELDEDYYNKAVQRFEEHISQKVLSFQN